MKNPKIKKLRKNMNEWYLGEDVENAFHENHTQIVNLVACLKDVIKKGCPYVREIRNTGQKDL